MAFMKIQSQTFHTSYAYGDINIIDYRIDKISGILGLLRMYMYVCMKDYYEIFVNEELSYK